MSELQRLITDIEIKIGEQVKQIEMLNGIIESQSLTIAHLNQVIRDKEAVE